MADGEEVQQVLRAWFAKVALRKKPPSSEAHGATDDSLKGSNLEGTSRICVTNGKEWDVKIVLNIIANDNHSSACDDDV